MNVRTIFWFLLGNREAIHAIVRCRGALLLGALLVVSAGFAREYDVEDLRHEPWHLGLPMAASFAAASLLYLIFYAAARLRAASPVPFWPTYRQFLTLFWTMAPMAWLYAIPVERWMSAGDAVRTNLWLLAIVSAWRVILISRCASILFGCRFISAFFVVMLFADTAALVILNLTPLPIFNIMGGIRLTDAERAVSDAACFVQFFGILSWGIWCVGAVFVFSGGKDQWQWRPPEEADGDSGPQVALAAWLLAASSIVIWAAILPYTQPPQQLRRQVEEDLAAGRIDAAVERMSEHGQEAFPPHWNPPPWVGYGEKEPSVIRVLDSAIKQEADPWVVDVYLDKWSRQLAGRQALEVILTKIEHSEFASVLDIVNRSEKARDVILEHVNAMTASLQDDGGHELEIQLRRDRATKLLEAIGVEAPENNEPENNLRW